MALGIYISVPFCRSKCTFCNFASGVFSRDRMQRYVDRVCADMADSARIAESLGAVYERDVDTIYLGGGTPSTLAPDQPEQLFQSVRERFRVLPDAEVTVECAPGTLSAEVIATLLRCGVNRVSMGVQSFVDQETRAVARLHDRAITLADLDRLRAAGLANINLDLIAGLPHQTEESWRYSVRELIASEVPHASVYILEVDEDSRLGRELIAGGQRYHAHHVPDGDQTARFYEIACDLLTEAGIAQYEISNFARPGFESRHNLKYWTRRPYLGFGVDAHSMLLARQLHPDFPESTAAVRFSAADDLDRYLAQTTSEYESSCVTQRQALEEEMFLGLRLNRGVALDALCEHRRSPLPPAFHAVVREVTENGLLQESEGRLLLTERGRLLSNEVFARFINL
ncbi:MAG: radical SAM family heme chaperone HemW [Acidobacteriales bacterium]|nr:radical SAM family heme chaperone HemW [Terriglobales bacterium]